LKIDQLRDIRVREYVMTAADTPYLEAQHLDEGAKVAKRNIRHIAPGDRLRSLRSFMIETVVTAWDGTSAAPGTSDPPHPELQTGQYLDGYRIELIETG
jgi:hypothetical protein